MIVKGSKINDRYQIIKTLGEGGMANVFLANDLILDRKVAVKVLRGDLANDEKFVRRFQREALSASSLSHPNIVEMYDVGEDNEQYYIVMEYVDGKTLKQVLKQRGCLSVGEVVDIMLQVTDGMAHAHDAYIIHRDIKPQNIMMLSNGLIKITDFGVATALNSTQLTQTNSVMGTVHYLPPEQANGKGSTIKSDIYSMGIMMYELLTGLVPYKGDNAVEIALKHLKEPLPSARKLNPTIPQSLENIIIKSTAKNPKNRYKDAREMHEDIKTALDESRVDEKRYVYKYSENDLDETKVLDKTIETVKETMKESQKDISEEEKIKDKKSSKKELDEDFMDEKPTSNKTLIIVTSILAAIVLVVTIIAFIYFGKTTVKNIVVPDVSNKEPVAASNELIDLGFDVVTEYKFEPSDKIEKGKVINTSPEIGAKRKEGTKITIIVSSGKAQYVIENFIGENYLVAKGKIEAKCQCNVMVEKEKISEDKKPKEDTIVKIEPAVGQGSKLGDPIKIYIPEIEYKYPNFTSGYTVDQIREFATKHELKLEINYQDNADVAEGTILKQSRAENSIVTPGATLVITISQKPEETSDPGEGDDQTDSNTEE